MALTFAKVSGDMKEIHVANLLETVQFLWPALTSTELSQGIGFTEINGICDSEQREWKFGGNKVIRSY